MGEVGNETNVQQPIVWVIKYDKNYCNWPSIQVIVENVRSPVDCYMVKT